MSDFLQKKHVFIFDFLQNHYICIQKVKTNCASVIKKCGCLLTCFVFVLNTSLWKKDILNVT